MKRFSLTFYDKFFNKVYEPMLRYSMFFRTCIVYYSFLKRMNSPEVPLGILINKEGESEYNINPNWFTEKKTVGISGIARLKNSADFLETVIESFLPYLDEIILVAEQASDGTNEICEKLAKKYPDKVRYFFYPFAIRFRNYDGDDQPTSNSIYSFAYFTNWCFSKSRYKYVMRLDDDIIPIPETWERMRQYIFEKLPNKYLLYYGLNIIQRGNRYGIMEAMPRAGTWGDNGIYPVSQYSYFTQMPGGTEMFHNRLLYKPFEFAFLHLKNLKKGLGTADYAESEGGKYFQNLSINSGFGEFSDYVAFSSSRIYEILLDNKIIGTR